MSADETQTRPDAPAASPPPAVAAAPQPKTPPWRDPQAKPYLRVKNVSKRFGEIVAVDDISVDIFAGEFFALLGPSGCGKTTLLRMLAGFETPTSGVIELDGRDIVGDPPFVRPVNMMFQSYALFPHMTVEKNIAFGLQQEGMPKNQISERVAEMLSLVKLEKLARRKPDQLSGGQRQRVALARALAKRPKLLLLDEPLGALDRKLREETQFELVNIQERLGMTFVIVTHDQEEAMTVSTRLAVMEAGVIAQIGEPRQVYETPTTRYVAGFLGDMNILDGVVETCGEGGAVIRCADAAAPVRASRVQEAAAGARIGVGLRPEKLVIERAGNGETPPGDGLPANPVENQVEGVIEDIAYLGDVSIYHVRLASGRIVKATRTNRERGEIAALTWTDRVRLSWDAAAVVGLLS